MFHVIFCHGGRTALVLHVHGSNTPTYSPTAPTSVHVLKILPHMMKQRPQHGSCVQSYSTTVGDCLKECPPQNDKINSCSKVVPYVGISDWIMCQLGTCISQGLCKYPLSPIVICTYMYLLCICVTLIVGLEYAHICTLQ